jgi:hypothetical protein
MTFSCTRLNVCHRSLPSSAYRRGASNWAGVIGVVIFPSESANRNVCAA